MSSSHPLCLFTYRVPARRPRDLWSIHSHTHLLMTRWQKAESHESLAKCQGTMLTRLPARSPTHQRPGCWPKGSIRLRFGFESSLSGQSLVRAVTGNTQVHHPRPNHCSRLLRSHPWLDLCVLSTISALRGRYESIRSALNSHGPESLLTVTHALIDTRLGNTHH